MASIDTEYLIRLTYSELYNEEIRDLLSQNPNENLKIIDDPNLGPTIQNITEAFFSHPRDVKTLLEEGENRRHFGVTNMNAHSSRSHVLVRLTIESRKTLSKPSNPLRLNWGKDKPTCISTLNLVDLAGSERSTKSGTSGQSLKEGSYINKSLLTLGTVISNLSEGKAGQYVPYRNSKLTRLLASALGGNAKTAMITCISPASVNLGESLSTLRFASRAKRIVNHVQKNEINDAKSLAHKLAVQNNELDQLKSMLDQYQNSPLKAQAVSASKNWRCLRFLVQHTPRIAKELRKEGQLQLAKRVVQDLQCAVEGSKDLASIVEEHSSLLLTHLPREQRLIEKLEVIMRYNEADAVVSEEEQAELDDVDEGEEEDAAQWMEGDVEGFSEELERSRMSLEDLRMEGLVRIQGLERDRAALTQREKSLRVQLEEQTSELAQMKERLKERELTEHSLSRKLNDLNLSKVEEQQSALGQIERLRVRVHEVETLLAEKESLIHSLQQEVVSKESLVERLRSQQEKSAEELKAANQSRRSFEEESTRLRNEMRSQMDRLRTNMHNLLQQGGEESKILEGQVLSLQSENNALRDELQNTKLLKSQVEVQVGLMRDELGQMKDNERQFLESQRTLREQSDALTLKMRSLRTELTQTASRESVTQQELVKLRADHLTLAQDLKAAQTEKNDLLKSTRLKFEQENEGLRAQIDRSSSELSVLKREINSHNLQRQQIETSLQAEITRMEKKLQMQSKQHSDAALEARQSIQDLSESNERLQERNRTLQLQNQELQASLDCMSQQIESILSEPSNPPSPPPFSLSINSTPSDLDEKRRSPDGEKERRRTKSRDLVPFPTPTPPSESIQRILEGLASFDHQLGELKTLREEHLGEGVRALQAQFEESRAQFVISLLCLKATDNGQRALWTDTSQALSAQLRSLAQEKEISTNLREQVQSLQARLASLQLSSQTLRSRESYLSERCASLEAELRALREGVQEVLLQEEGKAGTCLTLEQTIQDLQLQLEAKRVEYDLLTSKHSAAQADNQMLLAEMDRWLQEHVSLGSRLSSLEQDCGVLRAERDELRRIFLGPSRPNP